MYMYTCKNCSIDTIGIIDISNKCSYNYEYYQSNTDKLKKIILNNRDLLKF